MKRYVELVGVLLIFGMLSGCVAFQEYQREQTKRARIAIGQCQSAWGVWQLCGCR